MKQLCHLRFEGDRLQFYSILLQHPPQMGIEDLKLAMGLNIRNGGGLFYPHFLNRGLETSFEQYGRGHCYSGSTPYLLNIVPGWGIEDLKLTTALIFQFAVEPFYPHILNMVPG